ncbi:hypothetical protein Q9L58_009535 [Maublancomyces gigas]|uniref:ZZ-type domain-containing protein n=1 Tax=Discina gigas TaxID=1032678 RepID=A0ABR3G6L7_9PEZI
MAGQYQNQNNFTCDVCLVELVPTRDHRIHCLTCENYDACWDCHMSGRVAKMHQSWHEQETILPLPIAYPDPATFKLAASRITYSSPPDPHWGYMVTQEKTASELFARLAVAIYTYIDSAFEPRQTTWLEPEKCSIVLDLLGYTPGENAFRSFQLASQHNGNGIAWSDGEVAFVYRQYGWEHTLVNRSSLLPMGEQQQPFFQPVSDETPLLSRNGFIAMMLGDALCDPDDFCARLNRLLASIPPLVDPATQQYFSRRDVPRNAWPAAADQDALWKGDSVQQARIRRSEEQAAAERTIFIPNGVGYYQDTAGRGQAIPDGKPPGYWYYQQEFS